MEGHCRSATIGVPEAAMRAPLPDQDETERLKNLGDLSRLQHRAPDPTRGHDVVDRGRISVYGPWAAQVTR